MTDRVESWVEALPDGTHAAATARRAVRRVLADAGAVHFVQAASLATSELVTNALVHAGPGVRLAVWAAADAVRVEVRDLSPHSPAERSYAVTSATGRGLRLVANSVDRWGWTPRPDGKSVWFEIGEPLPDVSTPGPAWARAADPPTVTVVLREFPMLMHWGWQEHASALLREYLLYAFEDDPSVLEGHAQASDALSVLRQQTPAPDLPDDPDDLLDSALEPAVTADEVVMEVPLRSVPHFQTLSTLLSRATEAAQQERFLSPPSQPELEEMREWLCCEVQDQSSGGSPTPWQTRTEARTVMGAPAELERRYPGYRDSEEAVLVTNAASVIVAASQPALDYLGYATSADLVGRRILVVVPERYHQAHITGTTLNATNGRDKLLGIPVTVPVVCADGRETPTELVVEPHLLDAGETVFVATLTTPAES